MTHKEIIYGNKLIVNFMGYTSIQSKEPTWKEWYSPKGHFLDEIQGRTSEVLVKDENGYDGIWADVNGLKYHKSYDWLMPVVKKCWKEQGQLGEGLGYFDDLTIFKDIDLIWYAVIEFIKWHNTKRNE